MRLSTLFKNSLCYCLCYDEQSLKKYKSVGVTCRFITAQLNIQEELVTIDLYDEGIDGSEYLLYLSNIIETNRETVLFKVVGFTTDGAIQHIFQTFTRKNFVIVNSALVSSLLQQCRFCQAQLLFVQRRI